MSDNNNKLIISVLGLEKLFGPTMEYAGEQLLELVKFLVDRAKRRLHKQEKEESFHGIPGRSPYMILENGDTTIGLPVESIKTINPYSMFPEWYWPLHERNGNNYIDEILCKVDIKVDRNEFLNMLCRSLSLDIEEKQRVIDAWPTLSQFQADGLKKIFIEEQEQFEKLFNEHPRDIWSLVHKSMSEWAIIVLKDRRVGLESFLLPPLNGKFLFPYFALWPDFWQKNGVLLMEEVKDYRSASRAFQQACYLSPENAYCWVRLGYCYVRLKYFDYALQSFLKVTKLKPNNHLVLLLDICELYILKDELDDAQNSIAGILDSLPSEYRHVYLTLMWIINILKSGRFDSIDEELYNYVNNIENETPWHWGDLKDKVLEIDNLNTIDKKNIARFLQRLISMNIYGSI